jgi:hypothetical protein
VTAPPFLPSDARPTGSTPHGQRLSPSGGDDIATRGWPIGRGDVRGRGFASREVALGRRGGVRWKQDALSILSAVWSPGDQALAPEGVASLPAPRLQVLPLRELRETIPGVASLGRAGSELILAALRRMVDQRFGRSPSSLPAAESNFLRGDLVRWPIMMGCRGCAGG